MDYRKIIKSRDLRIKIMHLLSWVPDKLMLKIQYRIRFGRKLNLDNPKRLTEKIQWYKLNYYDPLMVTCAGKNCVRDYVKHCGLERILNEQYRVYECPDDVDFNELPERFVLKTTVGSAGQQVFVCQDKSKIDEEEIREKMRMWYKLYPPMHRTNPGREWHYNAVKQEIVAEKYIDSSSSENGLLSYKIFCFNGKARFVYLIADIKDGFFDADYGIYSPEYKKINCKRVDAVSLDLSTPKPGNWNEMIQIAEKLSAPFPHVRVDLYNVNGQIIFGELTFFNDGGRMKFDPDEYDYIFGDYFVLPEKKKRPSNYRQLGGVSFE